MRSQLIEQARKELIELNRRLRPDERLKAFAEISRLVESLHRAGIAYRKKQTKK